MRRFDAVNFDLTLMLSADVHLRIAIVSLNPTHGHDGLIFNSTFEHLIRLVHKLLLQKKKSEIPKRKAIHKPNEEEKK